MPKPLVCHQSYVDPDRPCGLVERSGTERSESDRIICRVVRLTGKTVGASRSRGPLLFRRAARAISLPRRRCGS